jgi:small subunit ribosomal protein S9
MAKEITTQEKENAVKPVKKGFISGTGRRKTAVARIFLYQEKGDFTINGMDIEKYFPSETEKLGWMGPFHAIGISHPTSQFTASIKVVGAGKSAQVGAVAHAIARVLSELSEENSKTLRKLGMLTRDSRMVERKKYYLRKARKAPQYSKR